MLQINNLHIQTEGKEILKGLDLTIKAGEVHAIMGPNGAGKSTLASVLAGKDQYEQTNGSIIFEGNDLTKLAPEERSLAGIFLAFQYPVEIPGVSNIEFLKSIVNQHRIHKGDDAMDTFQFQAFMKEKLTEFNMNDKLLNRNLNEGFSGGEKKKNELLQMALLNPKLKILDETDSGLDVDALKTVAKGVNKLHSKNTSTLVITHYNRILDYLNIDFVHIMVEGKIVATGGKELAKEIEANGYEKYLPKKPLQVLN